MKEKPNFFAIIPSGVRYDKNLTPNAKLLYAEITACYASNKYFSELYGKNKVTISRWIKELKERGYISVSYTYKEGSKEIANRYIQICFTPLSKNDKGVLTKMLKSNNTSINNKSINNKGNFKIPTIIKIKEYCIERNNNIDADAFFDSYESKGWMVGRNKMKSWKACVRTWETNQKKWDNPKTNDRTTSHRHTTGKDYGDGSF
jgi:pyocin large subunit-like protein